MYGLNIAVFSKYMLSNEFALVKNMDKEKKVKLECGACGAEYWAEAVDFAHSVDAPSGSLIPYTCPVCNHDESKVKE